LVTMFEYVDVGNVVKMKENCLNKLTLQSPLKSSVIKWFPAEDQ